MKGLHTLLNILRVYSPLESSQESRDLDLDCVPASEQEVRVSITPESTEEMVLSPLFVPASIEFNPETKNAFEFNLLSMS